MTKPIDVTDASFKTDVLDSSVPVMVDFWAEWCGPCKMIGPMVAELAQEYEGRLKVVKMDVDKNNATAGQYRIMSIPSLLFFKAGQKVDQVVGTVPKQNLVKKIDSIVH
ncbi:MAG: thioredoxin [candidate division Zixibacteria bacterium]|nr:thioredoxin [candidate division Zixibacteria bacterium]